ncbi:YgaP-like transmembrane domain [Sphingosinicella sp.]|uniref:YgaP-like transmembrane domain n=1 Tax=Sphingosinicella sp. TaxID=1917971 RepID=UPI004037A79A
MFAANVPLLERLIRLLLGLGIAAFAVFGLGQANLLFVAIGLCVAATGLVGFCPACALVGRRLTQRR